MLSIVLAAKPQNWNEANYSNVRYVRCIVSRNSLEYNSVTKDFRAYNEDIRSVERVQHPYAFGRYLLLKEQMLVAHEAIREKVVYHVVNQEDLAVALEYNCDPRRYRMTSSCREPSFSNDPPAVANGQVLIVIKKLLNVKQDTDASYYPLYVVQFD